MTANPTSRVRGRRQRPALKVVTIVAWSMAWIGSMSQARPFATAGIIAIGLVIAAPLLRVGWLIFRWIQERDWRFVWTATALLTVIAVAGLAALIGR